MPNNRFKKDQGATSARFTKKREESVKPLVEQADAPRKKSKVAKKQKGFRLPLDLIDDLEFVCFATGATEQKIGEKAIAIEIAKILKTIKNQHGDEGYQKLRDLYKIRG